MFSVEQLAANVLYDQLSSHSTCSYIAASPMLGWDRNEVLCRTYFPSIATYGLAKDLRSLSLQAVTSAKKDSWEAIYPKPVLQCWKQLAYGTSPFAAHWHFDFLSLCCMWGLESPYVTGGYPYYREGYRRIVNKYCSTAALLAAERRATFEIEDAIA